MKNGDMPANVLVSSTGVLWNLRDGHEDSQYLGQPNERFSFGLTKREHIAAMAMAAILSKPDTTMSYAAREGVMFADELLAELERTK